jgi:hypothetical protein
MTTFVLYSKYALHNALSLEELFPLSTTYTVNFNERSATSFGSQKLCIYVIVATGTLLFGSHT